MRGDIQGALADYRAALEADPAAAYPRFNTVTARLAMGDLEGAVDEYPRALDAALHLGQNGEGVIVECLSENWEALFACGHQPHWSRFLESSLRLLQERSVLHCAERALPLTVFALIRRFRTGGFGRMEQVIEHLGRDVAPFMDVSVAQRFLQVAIAHFKEHDPKALLRLPREERRVFTRELGLTEGT